MQDDVAQTLEFHFAATGIGSVPFQEIRATCAKILGSLHEMPFWPQFVRRSHLEDMYIQASQGLPLLQIREKARDLSLSSNAEKESELVTFYDRFLADDVDYFAISEEYAPGLYTLLELMAQRPEGTSGFVKGQMVGPVTFVSGISDPHGKLLLHNIELQEAMIRGLAIKALWQVRKLAESGRKPILFLDEPGLSGFGSAFSTLQRHQVMDLLRFVIDYLKEHSEALIGIHCCGNTDWPMILEAEPHIIHFDASDYMDYFLLYSKEIQKFLLNGGVIAWGIVPTASFTGKETTESLSSKLQEGLDRIHEWRIDADLLAKRSILAPACGMGTMTPDAATKVLDLLSDLSRVCRNSSQSRLK